MIWALYSNRCIWLNLTILDNILLPAMEGKKENESRKDKVNRAKELMKLSIIDIADNDINEVSGGQLQEPVYAEA